MYIWLFVVIKRHLYRLYRFPTVQEKEEFAVKNNGCDFRYFGQDSPMSRLMHHTVYKLRCTVLTEVCGLERSLDRTVILLAAFWNDGFFETSLLVRFNVTALKRGSRNKESLMSQLGPFFFFLFFWNRVELGSRALEEAFAGELSHFRSRPANSYLMK